MAEKKKYKSRFSGLNHDEATAAIVNKTLQTYLEGLINSKPNPNLLDNWYFGNPVDQRGGYVVPPGKMYWKTGYISDANQSVGLTDKYYSATFENTGYGRRAKFSKDGITYYVWDQTAVRGYCEPGYTIDRLTLALHGVVLVTENGINIKKGSSQYGYGAVRYYFENIEPLVGRKVTLSQLTTDGLVSATGIFTSGDEAGGFVSAIYSSNGSYVRAYYLNGIGVVEWIGVSDNDPDIKAVKLELGSQQTLALQDENGNWVLNEIPDYGEQLAKCQRYQVSVLVDPLGVGYTSSGGGYAYIQIPTPVTMRATPTFTHTQNIVLRLGGQDYTCSVQRVQVFGSNAVNLMVHNTDIPASQMGALWTSGMCLLDSNL